MNRKDYKHGAIIEIKLPKGLGYTYAKFLKTDEIFSHHKNSGWLAIKPYEILYERPLGWDGLKDVLESGVSFLTHPLLLAGYPRMKGEPQKFPEIKWKVIGVLPVGQEDLVFPDYKVAGGITIAKVDDYREVPSWSIKRNLEVNRHIGVEDYGQVRHLELYWHFSYFLHTIRISMEWIKKNKDDIMDYYREEIEEDFYFRWMYYMAINTPLYSEIPENIRGKAIGI